MTSDMPKRPCAEWAEKLAALHPSDLTAVEQDELSTHLASCNACAQVYEDYRHLASLVRDLTAAGAPSGRLPELPYLSDELEEIGMGSASGSQPGVTSSLPTSISGRRPWRASRIALTVLAAVLVAGIWLGSFVIGRQYTAPPIVSQGHGPVYYITPEGKIPPASTPHIGGLHIDGSPTPPFFIDGNVYRNSSVYSAATGVPVQQYLKNLGAVQIYNPRLVDGILYMAVRTTDYPGKMIMYALRASDGVVLWKWNDCGESVNMSSATISNGTVYFTCEAAPLLYRLYALQARTGVLLWHDIVSGDVNLDTLLVAHHTLYMEVDNQLLAKTADTGTPLWKRSFGDSGDFIEQAALGNGLIYIAQETAQGTALFALRASTGVRVWEYHFVGNYYGLEPFVDQRVVYLFVSQEDEPATIYSLDGLTGALHWQKHVSGGNSVSAVDHGNLYMVVNVFTRPQQTNALPAKRALLAIRGSDAHTLWQQDIPWNKGKLSYAVIEPPTVSAGGGRLYLVDWQSGQMQNLKATMGAFSESNGALLWARDVPQ